MLNESPSNASVEMVSAFYGVDKDLLDVEKSMFVACTSGSSSDQCSPPLNAATDIVSHNRLDALLPVLYEVAPILASIPASYSLAVRSFSAGDA